MIYFLIIALVIVVIIISKRKKNGENSSKKQNPLNKIGKVLILFVFAFLAFALINGAGDNEETPETPETAVTQTTVTQNAASATVASDPTATPMVKAGIVGSNAYDITVTLDERGFDIGKRQETATKDGYTWYISSSIDGTSYIAQIETNRKYEIYDATFIMTGTDATYLPWAATFPHDLAEQESTVAWVKDQQSRKEAGMITVGDAIWIYTPSESGGILRVQSSEASVYADAMLDLLISDE